MGSKIIGDTDGISEIQLTFVLDALSKYDNSTDILFEDVGKKGDNYLSTVKRITKEVKDDDRTLKIISKFAPTVEFVRKVICSGDAFSNETVMYQKVFPKFQELQKRFKVSEDYTFRYAECYGALGDPPNEVILLEDLRERGYVTLNKFEILSNSTMKVVLKNFAVYNAMSFAFKNYDPKSYEDVKKTFSMLFENDNDIKRQDMNISIEKLIQDLVDTRGKEHHLIGILTESSVNGIILHDQDYDSPRSIIQHGDAWTNNFLFQLQDYYVYAAITPAPSVIEKSCSIYLFLKEEDQYEILRSIDGEPKSGILIDFQGSKIGSTVVDLLFMLLSCSDHKSRVENFHSWIDYYYSELDNCLKQFGLNAENELPRDLLENDFRRYGKFTLGKAMMISFFTNRQPSEVVDIRGGDVCIDEALNSMHSEITETTRNKLKIKFQGMYDTCAYFNLLD